LFDLKITVLFKFNLFHSSHTKNSATNESENIGFSANTHQLFFCLHERKKNLGMWHWGLSFCRLLAYSIATH